MSYMSKFIVALVGMVLLTVVASRGLFLFVVMRDPLGLSTAGGRFNLGMGAVAAITACIAGALMSYFFGRHEKNKWSKVRVNPTTPLLFTIGARPSAEPQLQSPLDAIRRVSKRWLPEGQADDRMPMDGSVTDSGETPSGQRSFARRTHQLMFKKWSQARHD